MILRFLLISILLTLAVRAAGRLIGGIIDGISGQPRGAGASQRSAIAVTIIGGQLLCLALSLLVVPVGYSLVEEARELLTRRQRAGAPAPAVGD